MLAHLCFVRALILDALCRETNVEQPFCLLHLCGTPQVACDDALRNQLVVDMLSQHSSASRRRMQLVERIMVPVAAPRHSRTIHIILAELLGDVLNAGIRIRLAPTLRVLVVDARSPREDAQADHFRLRIPSREFPEETLISTTKRNRVREVRSSVLTKRHFALVPVVCATGDEDKIRHASPAQRIHAMIAEEGRITVEQVTRHTRTAPRSIGKESKTREPTELHPPSIAHLNTIVLLAVGRIVDSIARRQVVIVSRNGVAQHSKRKAVGVLRTGVSTNQQKE